LFLEVFHLGDHMEVDFFVENVKGDTVRKIFDENKQTIVEGNVLPGPIPFHYGFIIGTKNLDVTEENELNHSLDALLVGDINAKNGDVVKAKVIGALMLENKDHKIVLVPVDSKISHYVELGENIIMTIVSWFTRFSPVEGWGGPEAGKRIVEESKK